MAITTAPQITALQAEATANLFLSERLPDRFSADKPCFDSAEVLWHVAVVLTYPVIGSIGQVGEIVVSMDSEKVLAHTPIAEMKQAASELYNKRHHDIEAALSFP